MSQVEDLIRELGKDGKAWEFSWDHETDEFRVVNPHNIIVCKEKTLEGALQVAMQETCAFCDGLKSKHPIHTDSGGHSFSPREDKHVHTD